MVCLSAQFIPTAHSPTPNIHSQALAHRDTRDLGTNYNSCQSQVYNLGHDLAPEGETLSTEHIYPTINFILTEDRTWYELNYVSPQKIY